MSAQRDVRGAFWPLKVAAALTIFSILGAAPLAASARPAVWMFPSPDADGQSLRELLDNPFAWQATRRRIDGIGYADHWLDSQFSDTDLRRLLPQLAAWHLKLGLEVGALKPWGPTAEQAFAAGRRKWDRLAADGAHIDAMAMDEPFAFARSSLHRETGFAAAQAAEFATLVRRAYPGAAIGDIEPYPGLSAGDLLAFIDDVQERLRQMHQPGLDFFRLDVDWMHFVAGDSIGRGGWQGVCALQQQVNRRGIRFSLIYWAADYPSLSRTGQATAQSWESAIMRQGAAYAAACDRPDEMVIEDWVHADRPATPDTAGGTFTRSILDFTSRFAPAGGEIR